MDNIPHLQTLRRYLTNFAMVVKMARGKRSIWRCRSFRWLQRGWFHWVDPSFGSNLYWPGGCRKVPFSHCSWKLKMTKTQILEREKMKIWMDWFEDITYIERENAESIVLFNVARGPKLVKCALCHPGAQNESMRTTYDRCKLCEIIPPTEHFTSQH